MATAVAACGSAPASPRQTAATATTQTTPATGATAPGTMAPDQRPTSAVLEGPPDQPTGLSFPPAPRDVSELQVPAGHGASISLTFDDGPSPLYTPQVLALLTGAHVAATFCDIGQSALDHAALVRAEVRGGFALCDHSRDHDLRMRRQGASYERSEVTDGLHDLALASNGAPIRFYRQPGGLWDATVVDALYGAGLAPLRWSDDPRDWSRPGMVAIVQRVLLRLRPGAVVLLHDGGGNRTETVQALAWLLPQLRTAGWTFTLPSPRRLPLAQAARPE